VSGAQDPARRGAAPGYTRLPLRPDWLARTVEPVLEPALPIVDAHHHLWEVPGFHYLLPEFLHDAASGHAVRASVFMQSHAHYRSSGDPDLRCVGETEFVRDATQSSQRGADDVCRVAAGIVGDADLARGDAVQRVLDAHIEAGAGRFRGVRQLANWHPDPAARGTGNAPPGLLRDPAFRAGFACLAPRGLAFDAWVYHTQLDDVDDLARAFPETTIVLDHCGGPVGIGPYAGRRDEVFAQWRIGIQALARHPNVVIKLGGLGMRLFGADFHERPRPPSSADLAAAWGPWIETCVDALGADRCMFESNAPIDKGTCSYPVLWNAFKRMTARASAAERHALFSGTARRVYRIELPGGATGRQPP
jgi:predicted TIM-barrel fold metal-dependent hydrolase